MKSLGESFQVVEGSGGLIPQSFFGSSFLNSSTTVGISLSFPGGNFFAYLVPCEHSGSWEFRYAAAAASWGSCETGFYESVNIRFVRLISTRGNVPCCFKEHRC